MDKRVMVCDDSRLITMTLRDLILGYKDSIEVITVNRGTDALYVYNQTQPDLVFLDIVMPEISGLEVLAELMNSGRRVPVYMISSTGTIENIKEALDLGAQGFIQKPVENESIIKIMDAVFK